MSIDKFLKIAHRGYSEKYPENTLLAFEKAIEHGADMLELDVIPTKDNVLVAIHSDYIDHTSTGEGLVKDHTLDELRQFSFHCDFPECGHVHIPTLKEVIDLARGRVMLNVELKNAPVAYPGVEEQLVRELKEMSFLDDVIVSAFDHYLLEKIKLFEPKVKTGMLYSAVWLHLKEEVEKLKPYSLHPFLVAAYPEHMEWARENGYRVYTWVARDRATIEQVRISGLCDGIMADDMELFDHLLTG